MRKIKQPLCVALVLAGGLAVFNASAQLTTLPAFYGNYPPVPAAGQWQSSRVFYSGDRLSYATDGQNNRIPDYSHAGYRSGEAAIPSVPQVSSLSATTGDQTARIQAALDAVGARTPDANGIRGALLLNAGTYEIRGTLRVNQSGVVLRGANDGTSGTVLRATGNTPAGRDVVILGTGSGSWSESTTKTDITTSVINVNARSFTVASTSGFAVGDQILIRHPSTTAWVTWIGGGGASNPWTPSTTLNITYNRRITAISGSTITIDAPIFDHLLRANSQSTMTKLNWAPVRESGVENLRVDIVTAGGEDENHARNAITVQGAENCWVRNCTALHFIYAGVRLTTAVHCTIDDVQSLDPVAVRTGGNMYNLVADGSSQLNLFKDCHITNGRHGCSVNGGASVSGNVFYRITCGGVQSQDLECHRHWSQAALFDNCSVLSGSGTVKLINRGDAGSSHGWGVVHGTSWRHSAGSQVQKPPPAQNYGISDRGSFSGDGWRELQTSGPLVPMSLYEAQLCDRLAGKAFRIVARHSGKDVVVQNASMTNGANVIQWTYASGTTRNDEWFLIGVGGGYCKIINRHSGLALNVSGASTNNAGDVIQWPYSSSTPNNDQWKLEIVSGTYYRIVNRHSGKVLNVSGASTADGANVDQWSWANVNQQQFQLIAVP